MRSAQHQMWDAYMVTGRARADLAEGMGRLLKAMRPVADAFRTLSTGQAARSIAALQRVLAAFGRDGGGA